MNLTYTVWSKFSNQLFIDPKLKTFNRYFFKSLKNYRADIKNSLMWKKFFILHTIVDCTTFLRLNTENCLFKILNPVVTANILQVCHCTILQCLLTNACPNFFNNQWNFKTNDKITKFWILLKYRLLQMFSVFSKLSF